MKKLTILGVGLMGGALAKAVKRHLPEIEVCGYARSGAAYQKLKKLKFLDRVERDLSLAVVDADYVVLGMPIFAMEGYMKEIAKGLKKGAIVFDLGSTKELVEKWAKKYLPKTVSFVGCHPLCGSEKTGAQNSPDELYRGALCIITAKPGNKAAGEIKSFWQQLGCRVVFMEHKEHDRTLAQVSHLPHVAAFSLMNSVDKKYLGFVPPSFRDGTRVAGSPAGVWSDIFLSNRVNLSRDIAGYIRALQAFSRALARNDAAGLNKLIDSANAKKRARV